VSTVQAEITEAIWNLLSIRRDGISVVLHVGLGVFAADGTGDHSHALSLAVPVSFL